MLSGICNKKITINGEKIIGIARALSSDIYLANLSEVV